MISELTFGSLFAGIGGIDLGFERAGLSCRWQVEIDPFCLEILARHWPDVPRFGDITQLSGAELLPVDVIAGGFPCQPVSFAGQRQGIEDERWLWDDFARIVRVLRPRYVVVENVPGLLSANTGRAFGRVLADLALRGFDAQWQVLPAAALGAPHVRGRVFIVAYASRERQRLVPLFKGDCLQEIDNAWAAVAASPPVEAAGRTFLGIPENLRVCDGLPPRLDRLKALGNAVVPQVSEFIGRCIVNFEREAGELGSSTNGP